MRAVPLIRRTERFLADPSGGATAYGLMLLTALLMLGGYGVDVQNVMTARTKLQTAADSAAHAALLARETRPEAEAKQVAVDVAMLNMPTGVYGSTLTVEDVEFGTWDAATATFTPVPGSDDAVRVTAWRTDERSNSVATYLLRVVGNDAWNVVVDSVFVTYHPTCLREGFVAQDVVDLQSNNTFTNGFCIHSNAYVSLNSNNYFEAGTVVSMSDLDDLELPNSGYKTNEGLQDALHEGSWNIRIVERIDDIIAGLLGKHKPAYITATAYTRRTASTIRAADLVEGRAYQYTCPTTRGRLTFDQNLLVRRVVIVTNCEVFFRAGVRLEDTVIATTSPSARSISAPSGLVVGRPDNCAPGGDAQLLTMGGMNFPADLSIYNGQLLARGDIEFAANANGVLGAAMVAGGTISGTSNMSMAFCGDGMGNNFHAEYFRMVE